MEYRELKRIVEAIPQSDRLRFLLKYPMVEGFLRDRPRLKIASARGKIGMVAVRVVTADDHAITRSAPRQVETDGSYAQAARGSGGSGRCSEARGET